MIEGVVRMQVIGSEEILLEKINEKRKRLIQFASKYDLTDGRVVELSQELDVLINEIQMSRFT
jgi:hypothetical protein